MRLEHSAKSGLKLGCSYSKKSAVSTGFEITLLLELFSRSLCSTARYLHSKGVHMTSEKPDKGRGKRGRRLGVAGCGTPLIMQKAAAVRQFGSIEGVLAVRVLPEKVVLFIREEAVLDEVRKVAPDMKFMSRPIEYVVGGDIKNLRKPR